MDDDGDDKDDSKRRTRNLSEKKRRDQFNMLVNELSTMVSTNSRKMDKSTVLKSTITFLKNHNEITVRSRAHDVQEDWKPTFLSNEEFTYLVLEALEGFVIVFSVTGRVCYVSESISSLLGHNPTELVNKNIFDFAYDEEHANIYNILQNRSALVDPTLNKEEQISFQCHIRRGSLDFKDQTTYELVQFNGHFRRNDVDGIEPEESVYTQDNESSLLFVCTGRLYMSQLIRDVSLVDATRNEFTSRHSLEWKFLFLDHRAPPIIGYLPFEVLGTSGYDYYHFDDLEKVINCHQALMEKGELTSCYYRFLTKGQQWIWLQSRFYITYHQWNAKPEFVVCTHRVVSYADVAKATKQETTEMEPPPEVEVKTDVVKEAPVEENLAVMSPSYMSEVGEAFTNNYYAVSQTSTPSLKSASAASTSGTAATTGASWAIASHPLFNGSDTTSVSGESRSSQRNGSRGPNKGIHPALVLEHGMGAQYLNPAPYMSVSGILPLPIPSIPVIVSSDQGQIQLQRKHEELQQMIVRQQEELRQVKEQLFLARLGILQPIINVNVSNPEEMGQIVYENNPVVRPSISSYQQPQLPQLPPNTTNNNNQNLPQQDSL